jgi:hypothetical protein
MNEEVEEGEGEGEGKDNSSAVKDPTIISPAAVLNANYLSQFILEGSFMTSSSGYATISQLREAFKRHALQRTGEDCYDEAKFKGCLSSLLRYQPRTLLKIREMEERAKAQINGNEMKRKLAVTKKNDLNSKNKNKTKVEELNNKISTVGLEKQKRHRSLSVEANEPKKKARYSISPSSSPSPNPIKSNSKAKSSKTNIKAKIKPSSKTKKKDTDTDNNEESQSNVKAKTKQSSETKKKDIDTDNNEESQSNTSSETNKKDIDGENEESQSGIGNDVEDDELEIKEEDSDYLKKFERTSKHTGKLLKKNQSTKKFSLLGGLIKNGDEKSEDDNESVEFDEDEDENEDSSIPTQIVDDNDDDMELNEEPFERMDRTKIAEFNANYKSFDWKSNEQEQEEETKLLGCKIEELTKEDFGGEESKNSNKMCKGARTPLRHRLGRRWLQTTDKTPPDKFDPLRAELDKQTLQRMLRQGKSFPQYIDQGPFFALTEKRADVTPAERARRDAIIGTMRVNQAASSFLFEGASHLLVQDVRRGLPLLRTAAALIAHNQATAKHELMIAEDRTRTMKMKRPPPDRFQIFDAKDDVRSEEVAKQEQIQRELHRNITKGNGYNRGLSSNRRFFGSRSPRSKQRLFLSRRFNSPQTGRYRRNTFQGAGSAGSSQRANDANDSDSNNARNGSNDSGNGSSGWNRNNNKNRGPNARNKSTGRK